METKLLMDDTRRRTALVSMMGARRSRNLLRPPAASLYRSTNLGCLKAAALGSGTAAWLALFRAGILGTTLTGATIYHIKSMNDRGLRLFSHYYKEKKKNDWLLPFSVLPKISKSSMTFHMIFNKQKYKVE